MNQPDPTTPSRRAGLRDEIAAALEAADYRMDMRRGDLADAVLPVLYREWPWLRAEAEDAAVLPAPDNRAEAEEHRLALSMALNLGTGAPWDAIHDRATELGLPPLDQDPVARRLGLLPAPTDRAAEIEQLRERHATSLRRADEINNQLMEEVQRYADGKERPVLWSVYNRMHGRALDAEAKANRLAADRSAVLLKAADRYEAILTSAAAEHSSDPRYYQGVHDVILGLRRMAGEAQEPLCAECGHPQPVHREGDDPVTPGRCAACPDDDAHHDYEARQDPEVQPDVQVWPLARVLTEVRCGSQDWTWDEEWADLDRRHADTGYLTKLEQQIRERGITMPVLIGSDGRLWDGHHRLRIAVRLGIGYVPVEITRPAVARQDPAPDGEARCGCPNEDAPEHQFGTPDCTCVPFTQQTDPPRYLNRPTDTVDMISGWERGADCPHHARSGQPETDDKAVDGG